jgi:predicted GNAT family acetyltransferase
MSTDDPQILHDTDKRRFTLTLDNQAAILEYQIDQGPAGKQIVDFTHTFVPPEFRGKGHAEKLVRHGLSWAREQGYEIRASCWYARMFLRK